MGAALPLTLQSEYPTATQQAEFTAAKAELIRVGIAEKKLGLDPGR